MCMGATRGLAGLKFSTSPSTFGVLERIVVIRRVRTRIGNKSLIENKGWNFTLSWFVRVLVGLEDPFS